MRDCEYTGKHFGLLSWVSLDLDVQRKRDRAQSRGNRGRKKRVNEKNAGTQRSWPLPC